MSDINWKNIQEDYENGISLGQLSILYGVPKSTLGDKSKAGHWTRTIGGHRTPPSTDTPIEAVDIARACMKDLLLITQGKPPTMEPHVITMVTQSMTQCAKVIAAAPVAPDAINGPQLMIAPDILRHMSPEEKDALQGLLKAAEDRAQAEEKERLKRA